MPVSFKWTGVAASTDTHANGDVLTADLVFDNTLGDLHATAYTLTVGDTLAPLLATVAYAWAQTTGSPTLPNDASGTADNDLVTTTALSVGTGEVATCTYTYTIVGAVIAPLGGTVTPVCRYSTAAEVTARGTYESVNAVTPGSVRYGNPSVEAGRGLEVDTQQVFEHYFAPVVSTMNERAKMSELKDLASAGKSYLDVSGTP